MIGIVSMNHIESYYIKIISDFFFKPFKRWGNSRLVVVVVVVVVAAEDARCTRTSSAAAALGAVAAEDARCTRTSAVPPEPPARGTLVQDDPQPFALDFNRTSLKVESKAVTKLWRES
jgi:hypothetical protein